MMSKIVALIEEYCNTTSDCRFRADYSGRMMFGRTCAGIDIDSLRLSMLVELTEFLIENEVVDVSKMLGSVQCDNMGLGYIIYFPSIRTN